MGKRSHRFDEEDLIVFLTECMLDRGYMTEDEEITGFEYKTKRVKKGGWYHEDATGLKDEEVDVVRFIRVHTAEKRRRRTTEEIEAADQAAERVNEAIEQAVKDENPTT